MIGHPMVSVVGTPLVPATVLAEFALVFADEGTNLPLFEPLHSHDHYREKHIDCPRYNPRRVGKRNTRKLKTLQMKRG